MKTKKNETPKRKEAPLTTKNCVIQKTGDTDLRRGAKKLQELTASTGHNPNDGNLYAFSNCKNTIKIIQKQGNGLMMITKKTDSATDWPAYIPRGKQGHTKK
jgi:hypothetical protein